MARRKSVSKSKQPRTKYGAVKVTIDGIKFASTMEGDYYILLKDQKRQGLIKDFKLQPPFVLQEGTTTSYGKKLQPIKYISDFLVTYNDDSQLVIDVKGKITKEFALKRKMYEAKYPLPLILMQRVNDKIGWVDLDEYNKTQSETKAKAKRDLKKSQTAETIVTLSAKGGKQKNDRAGNRVSSK